MDGDYRLPCISFILYNQFKTIDKVSGIFEFFNAIIRCFQSLFCVLLTFTIYLSYYKSFVFAFI